MTIELGINLLEKQPSQNRLEKLSLMTNVFENSLKKLNWRIKLDQIFMRLESITVKILQYQHRNCTCSRCCEHQENSFIQCSNHFVVLPQFVFISSMQPLMLCQMVVQKLWRGEALLLRVSHFLAMIFQTMMNFSMKNQTCFWK